jgi:ABC-type Fe3+-hydroxamate transport system substrate-binding protein
MKKLLIFLMGLTLFFAACENTAKNSDDDNESPGEISEKKPNDERILIVPGKAIGEVYLGQTAENLNKIFGKANAGDAAMGKAWAIWYDLSTKDQVELFAVYTSYKDSTMSVRDVKQIRTESAKFETKEGLGISTSMKEIVKSYPDLRFISRYVDMYMGDTLNIYDDKSKGISFEFVKDKCVAVSVHPTNVSINETYLTLHPELRLIK